MTTPSTKIEASASSTKKQLLPTLIDQIAATEPEAIFAEYPTHPTSYESGYQKFSYRTFANTINGVAWWIQEKLGPGKDFPSLAFMGPNDILVNAFLVGAVKAGYKTLLTSPRNSIPAQENLFQFAACKVLVATIPQPAHLQPMISALSSMGIQVLELPNIAELVEKPHPHFPYEKSFDSAKDEPFAVLHTSGTTELPKPIVWNHDYYVTSILRAEAPVGFVNQAGFYAGVRVFNTFPSFHAAGLYFGLVNPVYNRSVTIYPIAGFPSASLLIDGLKYNKADIAVLVPPYVIDLAQNTENLEFIASNLKRIFYMGGAIPPAAGNVVSSKIELDGHVGATETGFYPSLKPANERSIFWGHHRFDLSANISFEHQADDLYEAVWYKNQDPEKIQPVFKIFRELETWRSKDLYSPHPTEADLWLYRGRGDDIIVFLTGEKTNPISMEHHINQHSEVKQAMVVGTLRFQAALLIELVDQTPVSAMERAETIERLWPVIEEANRTCPAHARVAKSHVMLTDPGRTVLMSAKGTIQRAPTLREYSSEIERLYGDADKMSPYTAEENNGNEDIYINIHDSNAVCDFLRKVVVQVTKWDNKSFGDGDNLFVQGMDSLQALQFVRYLRKALKKPGLAITILYTNPSLVQLAGSIAENSDREVDSQATEAIERGKKIEETIQRYCQLVDEIATEQKLATSSPAASDHVVILTGSTGSLGSHILDTLIQNTSVSHIYCLNRTSPSASSHRSPHLQNNQKENTLNSPDFPTSKITFLTANLSKPDLGLDSEIFAKLQNLATDFIHSAWPVNFNISLETFKPQLGGIVNILSFVSVISRRVSLLFVSSISSISALSSPTTVPEKMVDSVSAPLPMGYAESKFISEHILNHAAKKFPTIDIKVARVGQIAGPAHTDGIWKTREWLPSLVIASFHMGFIPENLGSDMIMLDWVPVDILSSSLIDIAFNSESTTAEAGARVFHPLNPAPTTWETLLPSILKTLLASSHGIESRPAVTPIPYTAWLQRLRDAAKENPLSSELDDILVKYPAIKLLDFFEKLPETRWVEKDVDTAIGVSEGLRGLKGIEGVWMEKWVGGWI